MPFGVWNHHVNVPAIVAGWVVVVVVLGLVNDGSIIAIGLKSVSDPSGAHVPV